MLQRRYAPRETTNNFDSDDDDGNMNNDEIDALVEEARLLPTNKVATRRILNKPRKSKKRALSDDEENDSSSGKPDEESTKALRIARLLADISRRQKIKSAEFIHDSDDEEDTERDKQFFDKEEAYRTGQARKVMELLMAEKSQKLNKKIDEKSNKKKRKLHVEEEKENALPVVSGGEDEDDLHKLLGPPSSVSKARHPASASSENEQETPMPSRSDSPLNQTPKSRAPFAEADTEDEDVEMTSVDHQSTCLAKQTVLIEDKNDSELDIISYGHRLKRRRAAILDHSDDE